MKFKVGDKVRVLYASWDKYMIGGIYPITKIDGAEIYLKGSDRYWTDEEDLELIKGGEKSMARKRYRLIKDSYDVKKGAIMEEICDDGTQDFKILDDSFMKTPVESGRRPVFFRSDVIKQPDWFVKVFQYNLTKEEIEKLNLKEKAVTKKRGRGRPKKQ